MSSDPGATTLWSPLAEDPRKEIDVYATELRRYLDGQIPEKVFLEFRLRHGVYGQRQPDVQMLRIKIPLGMLTAEQVEALAEVVEEYAVGIAHVTTRQDIQCHFVNILDTPEIFERLASVGITTREACGNSVRNVTACPVAGVCSDEAFDVTPYALATSYFLLRHPDAQNFGRKFKIAFSGCSDHACGLARMHDIGLVAREAGGGRRGFTVYVGGGLGPVPHQAQLLDEFVPARDVLRLAQAIARVFARLGEKKSRARARMKFLVAKLGIEEFGRLVREEFERVPPDPRRDALYEQALRSEEQAPPLASSRGAEPEEGSAAFQMWRRTNVRPQKQSGYSVATVFLPLGDLSSEQLRGLARVSRRYTNGTVRTTVEQNFVLRWVHDRVLQDLHRDLEELHLADPVAGTIADITACPGTDSCKLGIASSRGLAGRLYREFLGNGGVGAAGGGHGDLRDDLQIKISGCPNSCGQHHVANIGFFGSSKRKAGKVAPVFQVLIGGDASDNAVSYGLVVAKVAAHRAPEAVRRLQDLYDRERRQGEAFNTCMERMGKARLREVLDDLGEIGDDEAFFHDNRQPWQYTKSVGQGECAGEVVDQAEFLLEDAERLIFDASLHLEAERVEEAAKVSFQAMRTAADALLSARGLLFSDNFDTLSEFRRHFLDTGSFFPGFADYFFKAASEESASVSAARARQRFEEANLFVEEAHVAYSRMAGTAVK